jgi:phosphoglycolate phosphatase-like HAD superfamily hydrolase
MSLDDNPRLIRGTRIEVVEPPREGGGYRAAFFDFDGTLSLIRQGWQDVMVPMMVEALSQTPRAEPHDRIEQAVRRFVTRLTGEQTIYQMIEHARQVEQRGGNPLDPREYKRRYLDRLMDRIRDRREDLRAGRVPPDRMLVTGARPALEALRRRDLSLTCASGTDEAHVCEEAALLGVAEFFEGRIFGAQDDYRSASKDKVIERILREQRLSGRQLVTFGDGYVEIECTRDIGGTAVGVASDEAHPGEMDDWKRDRLIRAGAHLIIPDYSEFPALLRCLFPEDAS